MTCKYCGSDDDHPVTRCPRVKSVEFFDYDPDAVKRVEFLTPADGALLPSAGYSLPAPLTRDFFAGDPFPH